MYELDRRIKTFQGALTSRQPRLRVNFTGPFIQEPCDPSSSKHQRRPKDGSCQFHSAQPKNYSIVFSDNVINNKITLKLTQKNLNKNKI